MTTDLFSKKTILLGALIFSSFLLNTVTVSADDSKGMICKTLTNKNAIFSSSDSAEMSPFIDIDYEATIKNLPAKERAEASRLLKELNKSYAQMDEDANSDTSGVMENEDHLYSMICADGVHVVTINLLDKLNVEQRKKAETLWKKIQNKQGDIDEMWDELDTILDSVDKG